MADQQKVRRVLGPNEPVVGPPMPPTEPLPARGQYISRVVPVKLRDPKVKTSIREAARPGEHAGDTILRLALERLNDLAAMKALGR